MTVPSRLSGDSRTLAGHGESGDQRGLGRRNSLGALVGVATVPGTAGMPIAANLLATHILAEAPKPLP